MKLFEFLRDYLQGRPIIDEITGDITSWTGGLGLSEGLTDIIIASVFSIFLIILTTILLWVIKKLIQKGMEKKLIRVKKEQERLESIKESKNKKRRSLTEINTLIAAEVKNDSPYQFVDVKKRAQTISNTTYKIIASVIWLIVIINILDAFGVNVIPLITGAGIIGIAVAFGAQEFIKDFISGLFNIFENTYSVGESVEVDGFVGTVREIGLRTTKIEDWAGDYLIINNGKIARVINRSRDYSTAIVEIILTNKVVVAEATAAITKFCEEFTTENPNFIGPLTLLGMSNATLVSYTFSLTAITKPAGHRGIEREVRVKLTQYLEEHGFEGPQQTIIVNS